MTAEPDPADLHYLIEHQVWARLDADGLATVGITRLGVQLAGELYMCRPRNVGSEVEQGRSIAVVELAKSIVSVKSPLTGTVVAVNPVLEAHPERVFEDPYGAGWLARVAPADFAADAQQLVTGDAVAPAMAHHAWLQGQAESGS
jgi:glycine cleavage system H protein